MRIIIWHGYLLGGTGSNVYTRALARSWSHAGHDVVVLCQEPEPGAFDLGGARVATTAARRSASRLRPRPLRAGDPTVAR
ncbi:MAG: glycosyltransferase [Ilumatobacteraceae bacterium]